MCWPLHAGGGRRASEMAGEPIAARARREGAWDLASRWSSLTSSCLASRAPCRSARRPLLLGAPFARAAPRAAVGRRVRWLQLGSAGVAFASSDTACCGLPGPAPAQRPGLTRPGACCGKLRRCSEQTHAVHVQARALACTHALLAQQPCGLRAAPGSQTAPLRAHTHAGCATRILVQGLLCCAAAHAASPAQQLHPAAARRRQLHLHPHPQLLPVRCSSAAGLLLARRQRLPVACHRRRGCCCWPRRWQPSKRQPSEQQPAGFLLPDGCWLLGAAGRGAVAVAAEQRAASTALLAGCTCCCNAPLHTSNALGQAVNRNAALSSWACSSPLLLGLRLPLSTLCPTPDSWFGLVTH